MKSHRSINSFRAGALAAVLLSVAVAGGMAQPPHARHYRGGDAIEGHVAVPGARGWFSYDPELPDSLQAELEMDARELAEYLQAQRNARSQDARAYHEQNARALGDYYRAMRDRYDQYDVRARPVPQPAPWAWRQAPPVQPQPGPRTAPQQGYIDPYDPRFEEYYRQNPPQQGWTPAPDQRLRQVDPRQQQQAPREQQQPPQRNPQFQTDPNTDSQPPQPQPQSRRQPVPDKSQPQSQSPSAAQPQASTPDNSTSSAGGKVKKFLDDTFGPPKAEKVPDAEGMVYSPFADGQKKVDVRGLPPGTEVKDPYTGKTFIVP